MIEDRGGRIIWKCGVTPEVNTDWTSCLMSNGLSLCVGVLGGNNSNSHSPQSMTIWLHVAVSGKRLRLPSKIGALVFVCVCMSSSLSPFISVWFSLSMTHTALPFLPSFLPPPFPALLPIHVFFFCFLFFLLYILLFFFLWVSAAVVSCFTVFPNYTFQTEHVGICYQMCGSPAVEGSVNMNHWRIM